MKYSFALTGIILAAGLVTLGAGAAMAQASAQPAATAPTDVSGIGDWTVRCFPVASPSPCEMYEQANDKNTNERILGVSIAFIPSANKSFDAGGGASGRFDPPGGLVLADRHIYLGGTALSPLRSLSAAMSRW